jgi:hypothetical protein
MTYIMPLSIVSVNGAAIDVVNGPVALKRGGASPVALVRFLLYRLQLIAGTIFSAQGIKSLQGEFR